MNGYYLSILEGGLITLAISLASLVVAVLLGLAGAAARLSGQPWLSVPATVYVTLVRGIPELVLMLLVYYGGTMGLIALFEAWGLDAQVDIDPFSAGVLTIGFIYGAYMTETFRGAMLAVPRGQVEAAWAFGMGRGQAFWRVTLPQMMRHALPGVTNNWLVLIKATALVSLIGLHDMTYSAKQASAATREPFVFLLFAAALFLLYTAVSLKALSWLERRFAAPTAAGARP